jgi:hypothetical protein
MRQDQQPPDASERVCALGGSHVKITGITGVQERLRAQGSGLKAQGSRLRAQANTWTTSSKHLPGP